MKYAKIVGVLAAVAMVSACGGSSGGSSDAVQQAEESATAFIDLIDQCFQDFNPDGQVIFEKEDLAAVEKAIIECACPNGGTISLDDTQYVATVTNCKSSGGLTYNGNITYQPGNDTISFDFTQFGECSSVTGTNIGVGGDCGGTVTATCSSQGVTCSVTGTGDCDVECS